MNNQPSLFEKANLPTLSGIDLRDQGIDRAVKKANKDNPGWSDKAFEKIKEFLDTVNGNFMCEEIRAFAAMDNDFELPENARAWAGPLRKAKAAGLIEFVRFGIVTNAKAHGTPASVWRKK